MQPCLKMAATIAISRRALQAVSGFIRAKQATVISRNNAICWRGCPPLQPQYQCPGLIKIHRNMYCTSSGESEQADDVLYKKLLIEVKGHDVEVINSYEKFVTMAAKELDLNVSKITTPKRVSERYTLLKSAHIYKKHMVQYETRTNFRTIELKRLTGSTADTFLEYIQRNLPEGMAMKVTRHRIEALPLHIKPPMHQEASSV